MVDPHGTLEAIQAHIGAPLPVAMQIDHVRTPFVTLRALLDTQGLSNEMRLYAPLFTELAFVSPISDGEVELSHEEVVQALTAEAVDYYSSVGIGGGSFTCGNLPELVVLVMKFEACKYSTAVAWLRRMIWKTTFTAERIKIEAKKMVNQVTSIKRKGDKVCRALLKRMSHSPSSTHALCDFESQSSFLTELLRRMESEADKVIEELSQFRDAISQPQRLRVHMVADVLGLPSPATPWGAFLPDLSPCDPAAIAAMPPVRPSSADLKEGVAGVGVAVGLSGVESSYLVQSLPSISDYNHAELGHIMVVEQFLTALEGPMWKRIRGLGFSYSYSMMLSAEGGLHFFVLSKATNLVAAYKEAQQIVDEYATGTKNQVELDETALESTKSTVISDIIGRENTVSAAASQSLLWALRGEQPGYNKRLLSKVSAVTLQDVKPTLEKHIRRIFDPKATNFSMVASKESIKELVTTFQEMGKEAQLFDDLSTAFSLKGVA